MDSIEDKTPPKKKTAPKKSDGPAVFSLEEILGPDRQKHSETQKIVVAQNQWDMSAKPSQAQQETIRGLLQGKHNFRYTLVPTRKAARNRMVIPLVSFELDEPWNEERRYTLCEVKGEAYEQKIEVPRDEHLMRDIHVKM